jgi:hypothetical protein
MIGELVTVGIAMAVAAPAVSYFTNWISRRAGSPVEIKLGSEHVTLDLANELPPEQVNNLVRSAVTALSLGDKGLLSKVANESQAASNNARMTTAK